MGKRIYKFGRFMAVLILTPLFFNYCGGQKASVEDIKEQIKKELPIGTSSAKVIEFLDSRGIVHSGYVEAQEYIVEKSGYVITREIYASIPNARREFLVPYAIYMKFFFDENAKLIDYKVKESRDHV